ncbi:MAG: hypothetical protein OZSIB_4314 [Candidatus Ozemobacter sibiricus]|jgi:hypothetical protein|uniref:Uncharacterized protein n=1 Tax=Candidatus Ozemobacter sibiricus TaxID=2268124 RepID=A0A367ZND2_9BACT|nr:MAG: hypothetical protein OZSIB_4314 [Candidatus Ozemobacter sibiricus]
MTTPTTLECPPHKRFCWDVYNKSECETCQYFVSLQAGTAKLDTLKDIVLVDEETA